LDVQEDTRQHSQFLRDAGQNIGQLLEEVLGTQGMPQGQAFKIIKLKS
jgi:hypothetical protein